MSPKYFVPGHISCIFQPVQDGLDAIGSRGVGIRLSLGSTAQVEYRDDSLVRILIDGEDVYAPVTRLAVNRMKPRQGMDVVITNDLPMGQGFATSASGSLAAMLCIADIEGMDPETAYASAHWAEVEERGGLGDVAAITSGYEVPVRTEPGLPPEGAVEAAPFSVGRLTLATVGDILPTPSVLEDIDLSRRIEDAGRRYTDMFLEDPTEENLFEYSYRFGEECGLMPDRMVSVIGDLREMGYGAGMCMLGYSIFTDAPADAVREAVGKGAEVFACTSGGPGITRTE